MTDAPPEKFDAFNPRDFFSDHLDEVQKQWLYTQVMRLINTHSRSAPKTQKLLKPLWKNSSLGKDLLKKFLRGRKPSTKLQEFLRPSRFGNISWTNWPIS